MTVHVLVKNFQGVNDGVSVHWTEDSVKDAYELYTGLSYWDYRLQKEEVIYNDKYNETRVYEIEMPKRKEVVTPKINV